MQRLISEPDSAPGTMCSTKALGSSFSGTRPIVKLEVGGAFDSCGHRKSGEI
jgi:hypothetical protein